MSLRFVQFAFAASEEANYQSSFYEVSPCETSLHEAKDFALKFAVRGERFSPETSPCEATDVFALNFAEAKDVFAQNFAVRSERRFRPKVRPYSTRVLSVRFSPLNSQSFAGNVAVRGDIPNSPQKFAVRSEKFVLIPKRSFPVDYHRSTRTNRSLQQLL